MKYQIYTKIKNGKCRWYWFANKDEARKELIRKGFKYIIFGLWYKNREIARIVNEYKNF